MTSRRHNRWHRLHFIASGCVTGWGIYRQLWVDIPGTGQSPMDLLRIGYTQWELIRYFPITRLNYVILALAIAIALYGAWRKKHHGHHTHHVHAH